MKIYVMRHAESEIGAQLDPTRALTPLGKRQARMMGRWLRNQVVKPDVVIESNMRRSHQTAKRVADRLGLDVIRASDGALDPDSTAERAWAEILRIASDMGTECAIAVTHGPIVQELILQALGGGNAAQLHFAYAGVAHIDSDTGQLHWLVTPNTVARDEGEADAVTPAVGAISAAEAGLIEAIDEVVELLEAGTYTYEDITLKRWVLGPGGRSGNCEDCIENADEGEIEESAFFPAGDEPVDEPPLHPNCECDVEYRDTVKRVYA